MQWIQKVVVIMIIVGLIGGVALGSQLHNLDISRPSVPKFSMPKYSGNWRETFSNLDGKTAATIRQVAAGQVSWNDLIPDQVQGFAGDAQKATISAQVSMTPEEIIQIVRTEGTAGLLKRLSEKSTVTVNGLSSSAMEEARYQYCLGVVESHEKK